MTTLLTFIALALVLAIIEMIFKTIELKHEHQAWLLRDKLFFAIPKPHRKKRLYRVY